MPNREKVIKGLEHCYIDDESYPSCNECPYGPPNARCGGDMVADVLALLKVDPIEIQTCMDITKTLVKDFIAFIKEQYGITMTAKESDHSESFKDLYGYEFNNPVKPIKDEYANWICGSCREGIVGQEVPSVDGIGYTKHKYCPNCGRRVNWDA